MQLVAWQAGLPTVVPSSDKFVVKHLDEIEDLSMVRLRPVGPILERSAQLLEKMGKSVPELVDEWQSWHRDRLEPIATYALTSKFGPKIYERQIEKKLVARFLTSANVAQGGTIIRDGDSVALPEGSSALYVGLAIAAFRRSVWILTSNDLLLREYRDNPRIAQALEHFFVVGGNPDFDAQHGCSDHGGFSCPDTTDLFRRKVEDLPPTSVIVIPSISFLAGEGPFDLDANLGALKRTLIDVGLRGNAREVVFIADYSKHLASSKSCYGVPIYPDRSDWVRLFREHADRICVVTCPPPELRQAILAGRHRSVRSRDLKDEPVLRDDRAARELACEYDRAAKDLEELTRKAGIDNGRFFEVVQ